MAEGGAPIAPRLAEPAGRAADYAAVQRDFDLLVIGSGPAGQKAAIQASKLGRRVAVVDRGHMKPSST
jgi:alkyl hydroperoxide reductase subunit AhpF